MALINCPECKKEISDAAKSCPQCGFPLEENSKKSLGIVKKIFIVIAVLGLLFLYLENRGDDKSKSSYLGSRLFKKEEKKQINGKKLAVMRPANIFNEFKNNEVAAEEKYMNELVVLQGKIFSIESSPSGEPEIIFDINYGMDTVSCQFSKESRESISNLKKGQTVTIVGKVTSFTLGTQLCLEDCYFATPEKQ